MYSSQQIRNSMRPMVRESNRFHPISTRRSRKPSLSRMRRCASRRLFQMMKRTTYSTPELRQWYLMDELLGTTEPVSGIPPATVGTTSVEFLERGAPIPPPMYSWGLAPGIDKCINWTLVNRT